MKRRKFLQAFAASTAATVLPGKARAGLAFEPKPAHGWRVFELRTKVELVKPEGATQVWLPLPAIEDEAWMRPMGNHWEGNAAQMRVESDGLYGASFLHAQWDSGTAAASLDLVSRFATRDRAIDFTSRGQVPLLDPTVRALYTRATKLLPTDGIVRETAQAITRGAKSDLESARRIYDWICDNTFRDPEVMGCGIGDIRSMLVTRNLAGKCADLNALYVGLARAAGLPARDVYGIRVADSRFGYKSLGKSGDVSKAQHCRAEVWLSDFGWVPVDPADVRKVVLEERPGLKINDELVLAVREKLFGSWEMNWLAYNFAHDLQLPGSRGATIPFLMYPQGETAKSRLDSLDPESFRYRIRSREITT